MHLREAKIKEAILHPEEDVRLLAVGYFADSRSPDASIMPLVIQAVEKYGRDSSFLIMREAERLAQTDTTLDWLINELRQDFDRASISDDNLRFALALAVMAAPIDLLSKRRADIEALSNFPDELRVPFGERLSLATSTWGQGWEALEQFGRRTMKTREISSIEQRHADRIVESLARHAVERGESVLELLCRKYPDKGKRLMRWLEPFFIDLAGAMRLQAAIPTMIHHLGSDELELSISAATALVRIGTDAVVEAIVDEWWDASDDFRGAAAGVLEEIHTDLSEQSCLDFLEFEDDFDTGFALAHALLSHFSDEGIEPVRGFFLIDPEEWSPDHFDLLYHFVASATVMEAKFPEYDRFYQDALEANWGWGDHERGRLADAFQPDPPPRVKKAKTVYQFKITLLETKPPIWRRIQVENCTLDKLHEHIQTAMGWTNSHLHQFKIGEQVYGDPELLDDDVDRIDFEDSTKTRLSDLIPNGCKPFSFEYEYDFGDSWNHKIAFEGCPTPEKGVKYPICLEGERACPPEDVGGVGGYYEFLEAIADLSHEEHESFLRWSGGKFDAEAFDPKKATKRMAKGLPDWRTME